MKNLIDELKLKKLLKEEKKCNPIVVVLVVLGVLVVIATAVYALYRYFAPEYLDDFDEFEDDFEEDFFEDDEIVLDDSVEHEIFAE